MLWQGREGKAAGRGVRPWGAERNREDAVRSRALTGGRRAKGGPVRGEAESTAAGRTRDGTNGNSGLVRRARSRYPSGWTLPATAARSFRRACHPEAVCSGRHEAF